jgi:hypothetical protein
VLSFPKTTNRFRSVNAQYFLQLFARNFSVKLMQIKNLKKMKNYEKGFKKFTNSKNS